MKKNKMMRLASILLVLTLLTTCGISGTFAKYVTSASSNDSARVASWGVVLTAKSSEDSSFKNEYKTGEALTVKGESSALVVAPGTAGEAITFEISGTPEVATKIDITMEVTSDIHIGDYYPVVFTLKQVEAYEGQVLNNNAQGYIAQGTLATIEQAIEAAYANKTFEPGTNLAAKFELTWAWDFDANGAGTNDTNDTKLGDIAANKVSAGENESINISYTVTFKVTQVD